MFFKVTKKTFIFVCGLTNLLKPTVVCFLQRQKDLSIRLFNAILEVLLFPVFVIKKRKIETIIKLSNQVHLSEPHR